jgi:hypothetical protein
MCPQIVDEREAEEKGDRQIPHRRFTFDGTSGSSGAVFVGGGMGSVCFLDFLVDRVEGEDMVVGTEVNVVDAV